MPYHLLNGSEAPRAPSDPRILGYLYNHGGLNNQKMALAALLLTGIRDGKPVNLPYIHNRDQRTQRESVVRLEDVFDLSPIRDFAARHGLTIHAACPSGIRDGWDYFRSFAGFFGDAADRAALETALQAVLSLKPHIAAHPALQRISEAMQAKGIDTVVQLRIEADWRDHAARLRESLGETEFSGIGYMAIMSKVKNTFPDLRAVYATSDEKSLPMSKYELRAVIKARFDISVWWKSDFLPASLIDEATPLEMSLLDFEIARNSPRFVGLTTSTFANMLPLEKFAHDRAPVGRHYIYNTAEPALIERTDNGFVDADRAARIWRLLAAP